MKTQPTNRRPGLLADDCWGLPTVVAFVVLIVLAPPSLFGQDDWLATMHKINPDIEASFAIDEQRVQAAGIRKISGKHLDLYTDVRDPALVDEMVPVFDLAVQQWANYFGVKPEKTEHWKLRAFLIADPHDPARFKTAGLMPDDLPQFLAGFQRSTDLWIYLQPGDYYTRHLLIHEGTHGFMLWFTGGYGAPWYGEGMAEQFGVHRWKDQKLELMYRLRDRTEAEYWGRVKRIKDERLAGKAMTLSDVLNIPPKAFMEVRYYAWSWAGCEFFSQHEKTKTSFANLKNSVALDSTRFNQRFSRAIHENWEELERDWELFIGEMEYGYEIQRGRLSNIEPIGAKFGAVGSRFKTDSDRSWQLTEIQVKKGDRLRISGQGEFLVGQSKDNSIANSNVRPWTCQSNGITIQYYRGHPLGMLQAGILDPNASSAVEQIKGLLNPIPIGSTAEITAARDGILCLRINESPAKLDDNQGALEVNVEKLK